MKMVDGVEVACTPEEENEIRSSWEVGKILQIMPTEPSLDQKMKWMVEGGQQMLDLKMAEFKEEKAKYEPALAAAKAEHAKHYEIYIESVKAQKESINR